jgi:hypothetical protein
MQHVDADLRTPPSINTLMRVHKLYVRAVQVLAGRAIPPGTPNMETQHATPAGRFFRVYPFRYFLVRNHFMRRWAELVAIALTEAMQHTENRKSFEISTDFAGLIGQYLRRVYENMAIELFDKSREQVAATGFRLTEEDFGSYNPGPFFTSTEMSDTVPPLGRVLTEDQVRVLSDGINTSDLPPLQPWPSNLSEYYKRQEAGGPTAVNRPLGDEAAAATGSGNATSTAAALDMPKAPGP